MILIVTLNSVLPASCMGQRDVSKSKIVVLEPSHRIKNDVIYELLQEYITIFVNSDPLFDLVMVRIDARNDNVKDIYLSASIFESEKIFYQFGNNPMNPKGYSMIDGVLILLYNDIDTFFEKIRDPGNILSEEIEVDIPVDVHIKYRHYVYRNIDVFGNSEEYVEFVEELDEIND